MANASKNKGDRAEREATAVLQELAPDLVVENAMRMLGAGRKDDVGDLRVFDDVAIQVRSYKMESLGMAIRSSAVDSVKQAANGGVRLGLGMVPVPRAQSASVRWLACVTEWPNVVAFPQQPPIEFKIVSKMLVWLRDDDGPYGYEARPRTQRLAQLTGPATPVFVAPLEAWLATYRVLTLGSQLRSELPSLEGAGFIDTRQAVPVYAESDHALADFHDTHDFIESVSETVEAL